jgi:hypothetical protein
MKPQGILQLAIRLLGLVFLYQGLQTLPVAVGAFCAAVPSLFSTPLSDNVVRIFAGFLMIGWPLAVAYWLLRGAPLIMRIAYPETPAGPKEETRIGGAIAHDADA